jgi:hypothetical protein
MSEMRGFGVPCHFAYHRLSLLLVLLIATIILFQLYAFVIVRQNKLKVTRIKAKVHNVSQAIKSGNVTRDSDMSKRSPPISPPPVPEDLLLSDIHNHSSSWPFLSEFVWRDLVDRNQTFLLQPPRTENSSEKLLNWLHQLPWPVILILQNTGDYPWPPIDNKTDDRKTFVSFTHVLDHDNLQKIFVQNPSILHPKIEPLPLGLKWDYKKNNQTLDFFSSIARSGSDVKELFVGKANNHKVYVRPTTSRSTKLYPTNNMALKVPRERLCFLLSYSAPNSTTNCENFRSINKRLPKEDYFAQLLKHQFVTSPAGRGLDCFATWEILLTGGIPIVPKSTLDPMFHDLPVWLVEDWGKEVNDTSVKEKAKEFFEKADSFSWDKIFAYGWSDKIA